MPSLFAIVERMTDRLCSYPTAPVYSHAPVYNTSSSEAPKYETVVVPTYTTYCPYPTTVVYGPKTYTVVSATTLTLTSVTVTKPYYTSVVTVSSKWY